MTQPLLHHLRVNALREEQRGAGVAQVVEADHRNPGSRDQLAEPDRETVGMQRPAGFVGEHEPRDFRLGWGRFPDDAEVIFLYDKGDDGFGYAINLDRPDGPEWGYAPFGG